MPQGIVGRKEKDDRLKPNVQRQPHHCGSVVIPEDALKPRGDCYLTGDVHVWQKEDPPMARNRDADCVEWKDNKRDWGMDWAKRAADVRSVEYQLDS